MYIGDWLARFRSTLSVRRLHRRRPRRIASVAQTETLEVRTLLAAPVAVDDSYEKVYNSWLTRENIFNENVLLNDFDPDSNIFYAEVVSQPSQGTLEYLDDDGGFKYIPTPQWVGTTSFTCKVYEWLGGQKVYGNTATVTLTLTNSPPDPKNDLFMVKPGGTLALQNVKLDNRNGPDTNPESPQYQNLTFSLVSQPEQGMLSFSSSGQFSYTANQTAGGPGGIGWLAERQDDSHPASFPVIGKRSNRFHIVDGRI